MATPYVTLIEERVHSTQDLARAEFLARRGTPVLAVAGAQSGGRGRRDQPWWNCPRPMLASLAVASPPLEHVTLAPLVAGVAAHAGVESQLGLAPDLKWPNDIMLGDVKVGGILSERDGSTLVVGCGLNLWWPDPPEGAGALLDHDPGAPAALELAHDWASRLVDALAGLPASFDKSGYTEICSTIGHWITWLPRGAGRAIGITADGALVVASGRGQETLRSGAVRHVRAATMPPDANDQWDEVGV